MSQAENAESLCPILLIIFRKHESLLFFPTNIQHTCTGTIPIHNFPDHVLLNMANNIESDIDFLLTSAQFTDLKAALAEPSNLEPLQSNLPADAIRGGRPAARSATLKITPNGNIDLRNLRAAETIHTGLVLLDTKSDQGLNADIDALARFSGSAWIGRAKGLPLEFHAFQHRSMASAVKHPGHIYRLDSVCCFLVLAGCWDYPQIFYRLFRRLLARNGQPISGISKTLQYGGFISRWSLWYTVRWAAYIGVLAEQPGSPVNAARFYVPATSAVAAFLRGERHHAPDQYKDLISEAFAIIFPQNVTAAELEPLTLDRQSQCRSQYWGGAVGICLGGIAMYGDVRNERSKQHKDNLKIAINVLAGVLNAAGAIGGAIGAGVSAVSDPILDTAYPRINIATLILGVAAGLSAGFRREPGNLDADAFADQLQRVLRYTLH